MLQKLFCDVAFSGISLFYPGTTDLMQGSGVETAQLGLMCFLALLANCGVQHGVGVFCCDSFIHQNILSEFDCTKECGNCQKY